MEETNIDKLKLLKSRLQRKFDDIYQLQDERSYLRGVADYIKSIVESDYLDALVQIAILEDRKKFTEEIEILSIKSVQETIKTFKQLEKIIKKEKIDDEAVRDNILAYKSLLNGDTKKKGSGNFATYLIDEVRDILFALEGTGHKEVVDKFRVIDETGRQQGFNISPSENKLEKAFYKLKRERNKSVWGDWEYLYSIYEAVHKQNELWENMDNVDRFFSSIVFHEINLILEGKGNEKKTNYFKIDDFKNYLLGVHRKLYETLEDVILKLQNSKNKEEKTYSQISFNDKTLSYQDETYSPEKPILCMLKKLWGKNIFVAGNKAKKGNEISANSIKEDCKIDNIDKAIDSFNRIVREKNMPLRIHNDGLIIYLEIKPKD